MYEYIVVTGNTAPGLEQSINERAEEGYRLVAYQGASGGGTWSAVMERPPSPALGVRATARPA